MHKKMNTYADVYTESSLGGNIHCTVAEYVLLLPDSVSLHFIFITVCHFLLSISKVMRTFFVWEGEKKEERKSAPPDLWQYTLSSGTLSWSPTMLSKRNRQVGTYSSPTVLRPTNIFMSVGQVALKKSVSMAKGKRTGRSNRPVPCQVSGSDPKDRFQFTQHVVKRLRGNRLEDMHFVMVKAALPNMIRKNCPA